MSRWKRKRPLLWAALVAILFSIGQNAWLPAGHAHADSTKIALTTAMVVNESGQADATDLVDEQTLAGDPKGGTGGQPSTAWNPGVNGSYPASAYIDLGQDYNLTDVYLFDTYNIANLTVSAGNPGSWTALFTDPLNHYLSWRGHAVNVTTRYVRVTMAGTAANVAEIVLYGSPASGGSGDSTAPAAISDLTLGYAADTSINLSWTTTGDDDRTGTAASYDIRYSTSPITAANWAGASQAAGEPAPYAAGYDQSFNVTGLSPSTDYYFAIEALDEAGNRSALSNVQGASTGSGQAGAKLMLDPTMVTNESLGGDAGMLVDEQALAGDPKNGSGGAPANKWFPGWGTLHYPATAVIDLGAEYNLTDVYIYDGSGTGHLGISTGTPSGWTLQFTDTLPHYLQWNAHPLTGVTTRYVQVKLQDVNSSTTEILLYGTRTGAVAPPSPPAPTNVAPVETFDRFMGANAFIDDPQDKMQAVGAIREYHNWSWDETSDQLNAYQPSNAGGGSWYFDDYYADLKNAGLSVHPAIQGSVSWLTSTTNSKPVPSGDNPNDPSSYAVHADHMFQVAARYGSQTVSDSLLKLAAGQPRVSGLNTLAYYEDWNEENADWAGDAPYFSPYNYAAMASADYDGDQGRLGSTFGIKNADPNARMVMGGLAGINVDYIQLIKYWSDWHRGGSFPADVLNVHAYCSTGTVGISPEQCDMKGNFAELLRYRNQYLPNLPIWITEFGYDTNPASPHSAPVIGSSSNEEVQGEWLVRSYLALASAGLDRAYMYMLRDVDGASSVQYNSSGLLTSQDAGETPKISWYYVYATKNALTGTKYEGEQDAGNPNVKIYRFKDASGSGGVYAVWCPTANGTTVSNYSLALQGAPTSATQVALQQGDTDGVSTSLTISGGHVSVNVSERPVFIKVDQMP